MEKSRIIRYSARSLLGLISLGLTFFGSLNAKEIFDLPSSYPAKDFDYSTVKTVSFFFSGNKSMDVDGMVKAIAKEKADVIITGKASLEGDALSPTISTYVLIEKDIKQKIWLVTIDSSISGIATKNTNQDGKPYRSFMPISGRVLVFMDPAQGEVESAISVQLQEFVNKITSTVLTRPKFFVVH